MSMLDDFRAQNPVYKDIPDDKLADGLYQKYYAGKMSREDFNAKVSGKPAEKSALGEAASQAGAGFKNVGSHIAEDFTKGGELGLSGFSDIKKAAGTVTQDPASAAFGAAKGAGKVALGGTEQLFAPLSGFLEATVGDPIKKMFPGEAGQIAANSAVNVASLFAPGAASKTIGELGDMLPALSRDVKKLMDAGVNLTPGHMATRVIKGLEDAVSSWPGVGSFVRNAQARMFEDFNRAVVNKSLNAIGEQVPKDVPAGRQMIAYGQKALGDAYNKIIPKLTWQTSPEFDADVAAIEAKKARLPPEWRNQMQSAIDDVKAQVGMGALTGEQFKKVESELSYLSRLYTKSAEPEKREYARYIDDLNGALRAQLERSNPKYAGDLQNINSAWAMFKRAEGASVRRPKSGGIFTPNDLLADIKRYTPQGVFARGDAALQDFAEAGERVLPQEYPSSGTTERALWAGALGGAHFVTPEVATGAAAATLPYTKVGQRTVNEAVRGVPRAAQGALDTFGRSGPAAVLSTLTGQAQGDTSGP